MKKSMIASLLIGLLICCSSCISATIAECLPMAHDLYPVHPIDIIQFSKPDSITETWALLSNGSNILKEPPAVHFYNNYWINIGFFNLEPFEKPANDLEQTIYLSAKQVKLWSQQFMIMNQEPYIDLYSYSGDFVKRFRLPIENVENLILQNSFIFKEDLVVVSLDTKNKLTRILSITPKLEIKSDWTLDNLCSQVTTDGHNIYALVNQEDSTSFQKLDINSKITEELKILSGNWYEIVYKNTTVFGIIKTKFGSALVETDGSFEIKKTLWSTQFEKVHISYLLNGLSILVDDTKGYFFWDETKGLRLVRDDFVTSETYAYFPLCVKRDAFNNLLLLDEDQKISVINIEVCNPSKLLVYDSYCVSNYKISTPKAWGKRDTRFYFADKEKAFYETTMELKKPVKIYQFERKVEQIETTDENVLILLEDSTLWSYVNGSMTQVVLPKVSILSMIVEENIPYFLISADEKESIQYLEPNTKELTPIDLHIGADTQNITMFSVVKPFSEAITVVFTIESTIDGDYLCIYGKDGKKEFSASMNLVRQSNITKVDQIFYYAHGKFLMVSSENSTVIAFQGIQVD